MKILLLALTLVFTCAALDGVPDEDLPLLTGNWKLLYLATNNTAKVLEESVFIIYFRKMQYMSNIDILSYGFYFKYDGVCFPRYEYSKRQAGNAFIGIGPLNNYFQPVYVTEDVMIVFYINVSVQGVTSYIMQLLAKETCVSQEVFDMYMDYTREVGIPEENLVDVIKTDNCPDTFPV